MLLISALALGLIETVNPSSNNLQFDYNIGSTIKYLNNNYKNFYHSSSTTATASEAAATAAIVAKAPVSSASLSHTKFKNNLKYNNNYYKKDNDNNDFINNNDNNNEIIDNVMAKAMTPYYNNHHQYHQYHQSSGQSSIQLKKGITSVSKTIEAPATATLTKRTPLVATTETIIAAALASGTVTSILPINTAESLKSSDLLENYQKYYQNSVDYNKNNYNKNNFNKNYNKNYNNKNNYNLNSEGAIIIKTRSTTETTTETIILDSVIISDNNNYNNNNNNNNNSNGANLLWNQFIYNNKTNNHLNRTNNLNNFDNNNNKNNNNINKNNNNNNYNYIKNKIRYQKNNNNMMLMMPSGIDSSSIIDNSGNIIGGSINGIGNSIGNTGIIDDNNGGTVNFDDWSIKQCLIWSRPYEIYFQLSNAFFLIAFIAPNSPYGMLWMRSFLLIGCVLMATYGWFIQCRPDVILWSGLFLSVNFIYLIILICRLRPIRFEKEIEAVYESLFKPLRVSRHQFKKVLNCMKLIRSLKYQEVYAQEKVTKVDSLSLVLSGKLVVSQNQRALHIVFPHQFLDSPEWFGVSTDDYFQVSIMAMEESRVLIWHRDKLKLSIMTEPFLQAVFDHILGRDVVKKLMQVTQVSETMASNGFLPSGNYGDDSEDKPMLCIKKNEGHGLTALINRQLQALPRISKYYYVAGDPNAWRLGRIEETDHETAV